MEATKPLFTNCRRKQARNFEAYLTKHRTRIINYAYYQAEQLCSIGSGAVESALIADWTTFANLRCTLEDCLCQSNVELAMCLPQWTICHLTISTKVGCSHLGSFIDNSY